MSYPVGDDPWGLALGDVNGDGRLDVVVANSNSGNVSILLQNPAQSGSFLPAQNVTTGGTPYSVAISDINGDGSADLAVALQNTGGGAVVLLQNPVVPLSFLSPIHLSNGTGALSVTIGDLNHDGRPDIAIDANSAVDVFFQDSTGGTFGAAVQFVAGNRPVSVAIADVNTDGFNDLVLANGGRTNDGSSTSVSVLSRNSTGPGNFLTAVTYPVPNEAWQLAVGQLMGGPAPDIAVISLVFQHNGEPSKVSILQNQGAGSFVAGQVLTGPLNGNFIAVGDVNGDGLPDLVVNDGPQVMLQNISSPGNFKTVIPLP